MYYKLPVKQRLEYMNSFRKANPRMSYHDMVKDYNETFEKFENGGKVEVNAGGEKHLVYKKESPTGNGKGIESHIMVTHPTKDKGKWDTIDLTAITNYKVKTVQDGVESTKKWHAENPEYAYGGIQKFNNGGIPDLKSVNTYQGGKEQNSIANTNNEEYLRQKFLAQKNAEKDLRISDFLLKTTSYLPGTAGVIGGVANATKNIAEDDYKGALSEIVSTFAPKGELKGAAKIYSFYNDFIKDKPEKPYGTTQFYSDEDIKRILGNKNKSITKQ